MEHGKAHLTERWAFASEIQSPLLTMDPTGARERRSEMSKGNSKAKPDREKKPNEAKAPMAGSEAPDAANMDKIRDILFGNQARDYEKRLAQMDDKLAREISDVREEILKRIDGLEVYIKKEMKALSDRLKNEAGDRTEGDKELTKEFRDASASLNKKIVQVDEDLAKSSTDLRDHILDQSKRLSTEIQEKYEQTSKDLKQAVRDLSDAKVDRSALAAFFTEIAMRLSGDQGFAAADNPED
jgi:Skp family chaperone for outer membrane proteins